MEAGDWSGEEDGTQGDLYVAPLALEASRVCIAGVDDEQRAIFLRRRRRSLLVGTVMLAVAGGFLIAGSVWTDGALPVWFGIALVLGAPLLGVVVWVARAKVTHEVAADPERYRRVRRGQLVGAWMATGVAALMLVTGLVLLFVNTVVGGIATGIGALYLAYRLFDLRDLHMH